MIKERILQREAVDLYLSLFVLKKVQLVKIGFLGLGKVLKETGVGVGVGCGTSSRGQEGSIRRMGGGCWESLPLSPLLPPFFEMVAVGDG